MARRLFVDVGRGNAESISREGANRNRDLLLLRLEVRRRKYLSLKSCGLICKCIESRAIGVQRVENKSFNMNDVFHCNLILKRRSISSL